MADELADMRERMAAVTEGKNALPASELPDDGPDPRIQEAIAKMNKLDKILRKKVSYCQFWIFISSRFTYFRYVFP